MSQKEIDEITKFVDEGGLGEDPSSKHFIYREKCIRFVLTLGESFISLSQDYFIQESIYNRFSGGYKRHYKLCPDYILQSTLSNTIRTFINHNKLQNRNIILIQLQSSYIKGKSNWNKQNVIKFLWSIIFELEWYQERN